MVGDFGKKPRPTRGRSVPTTPPDEAELMVWLEAGNHAAAWWITGEHTEAQQALEQAARRIVDQLSSNSATSRVRREYFCKTRLLDGSARNVFTDADVAKAFARQGAEISRSHPFIFIHNSIGGQTGEDEFTDKEAKPTKVPAEEDRLAFLADAAQRGRNERDPLQDLDAFVRADAIQLLGGEAALGRAIVSEEDLVEALVVGFPADVLVNLREAGYSYTVLEQVIAPRRTLMRRKAAQQRLTRGESDASWRLAHVLSMAGRVLDGRKAALAWLSREKVSLKGRTPIELLETSVGTAYVERILRTLDWGDVA